MISIKPVFLVKEHKVFIYPGMCKDWGVYKPVIKLVSCTEPTQEFIQYSDGSYCLTYGKQMKTIEVTLDNFGNTYTKSIELV